MAYYPRRAALPPLLAGDPFMNRTLITIGALLFTTAAIAIAFAETAPSGDSNNVGLPTEKGLVFKPDESATNGTVTVEGTGVSYQAVAGTLVVHPKGWDDVTKTTDASADSTPAKNTTAEASMFYVAYFRRGADAGSRPITFIYNGGPGSSTVWLHMGAFGPRRVVTNDDSHTPAAPYSLVNNDYSLLDASDLVFIDAPGTGFSRIAGKDKDKAFFGVDADAHAFSDFIVSFLSKYGRWNSPKYLFGESYGTPRSAVVVNELETNRSVDFNGVILLSQILNYAFSPDGPQYNPGIDQPYELALPTYAATAWYHHKLPGAQISADKLPDFLHQVEHFAMTDYALALNQGSSLSPAARAHIIAMLHAYTGLPAWYIDKADLRIDGGEFEKNLQDSNGDTTGRLDTRFSGPSIDPLSKESDYDPQSSSISSAYVSAFNDYVRKTLNYGQDKLYRPGYDVGNWNVDHQPPGSGSPLPGQMNVMPDLANAMKVNPDLKVLLNGGYFDLATPYYEGWYEMHHLQIPAKLQNNIQYRYYQSGHMVYAHEPSLKELHDNVAAFINATNNVKK
jgi:carboxypeptidase C (cathepsin A)